VIAPSRSPILPLNVEDVLERLEGVHRIGEGKWMALCPAHGDKVASLSVRPREGGGVHLNCFAGCTFTAIIAALGLLPAQFFPPPEPWAPTRLTPRRDRGREWFEHLQRLHQHPLPDRYRKEMVLVGTVLAGGTSAFAQVPIFDAKRLQSWGLRVLWQAMERLMKDPTRRKRFSLVALAREVDFVAGRPGYFKERGLYRLGRLAVGVACRYPPEVHSAVP